MKNQQPSFTATLQFGRQYTLMVKDPENPKMPQSIVFKNGEPVPVTAAVKAHLETNAVQNIETVLAGENVEVRQECQFSFEALTNENSSNT